MRRNRTKKTDLIDVAMGRDHATLAVRGGSLVNVYTKEIERSDVAIKGARIAAIGDIEHCIKPGTEVVDATGMYLVPGLIEPHLHAYHAYTSVTNVAKALLTHGTTTTADGMYGPAIIAGVEAVRLMLDEYMRTPLKLIFVVPTLGYLQNRELGIEPAPLSLSAEEMIAMLDWPETIGLEEPPFLPLIDKGFPEFIRLYDLANEKQLVITGHGSEIGLQQQLNAYVAAGTVTDHEARKVPEVIERARRGMKVLMRQGSGMHDLRELSKALTEHRLDSRAFTMCSDAASIGKLIHEGDIDECIRVAVQAGIDPLTAIQMATLNAAQTFKLEYEIGSITPGRIADILLVQDLRDFVVDTVVAEGELVVEDGSFIKALDPPDYPDSMRNTIRLGRQLEEADFVVAAPEGDAEVEVRAIGVVDFDLVTPERRVKLRAENGRVLPDADQDIALIAMADRHGVTGKIGVAFVQGYGLAGGAFGSSVNAVCENLLVVGTNPRDMTVVANHLAEIGGGKAVAKDGVITASWPLPLLGLLSDEPLEVADRKYNEVDTAAKALGCKLSHPFNTLEFCGACGEVGELKIYQGGLINVTQLQTVPVLTG